ncbi:hypothetical protein JX265_011726 [Neoarthrinium moseri]|uniref:Uncharacterized protein n=1 Tax=Neoarthrinium moseri TaxID=1658444 RepID=A0A9P9WC28_9PEZI|nr:hypothetical protein JX266_005941 [Neoarthrinium moseri]KAI1856214.1 hypothetical protein JX265_011726 [Neoarthrinium moseri]
MLKNGSIVRLKMSQVPHLTLAGRGGSQSGQAPVLGIRQGTFRRQGMMKQDETAGLSADLSAYWNLGVGVGVARVQNTATVDSVTASRLRNQESSSAEGDLAQAIAYHVREPSSAARIAELLFLPSDLAVYGRDSSSTVGFDGTVAYAADSVAPFPHGRAANGLHPM